ncbi:hypothetical protein D9M70_495900 [compost metagenome]
MFGLFLVGGDPVEQGLQGAGLFAGVHQVAVEIVEVLGLLAQRTGEAVAGRHLLLEFVYQLAHPWVVEAFADDVEALQQRHASPHHGCHLSGEQGDVHGFDLLAGAEQRDGLLAYPGRIDALLAQMGFYQGGVLATQFALDSGAFLVGTFPGKNTGF